MADAGAERTLAGVAASDGLVVGALLLDRAAGVGDRRPGTPVEEMAVLRVALGRADEEIAALAAAGDALAAEILEFQSALIEDDDLVAPIVAAVAAGESAQTAWRTALDREIGEYRAAEDEYMAARAGDLVDLRDRVLRAIHGGGTPAVLDRGGGILVADDLTPSRFLELDWSRLAGAALRGGSRTSHVAILARARGVPLVVGLDTGAAALADGTPAILDAETGRLVVDPGPETLAGLTARLGDRAALVDAAARTLDRPAATADGEPVAVLVNVDDPARLAALPVAQCDGIGLTRTEFLFDGGVLPAEECQLAVYRRILQWAEGRPVTIRTLDAGGDKPIPGVTPDGEGNPFLGVRGLRLSLAHPAMFRVQLRALARAAAHGPLKIMVPMVTVPAEIVRVRALLDAVLAELAAEGVAHAAPPLGMMVEVPAAALTAEAFAVDFYSIGSNDLVQYVTACARDNPSVADLADPANPAVLELIGRTVEAARRRGVEVSLCGDMASDPALVPLLLERGLRTLSVAPAQVGRVKLAVAGWRRAAP